MAAPIRSLFSTRLAFAGLSRTFGVSRMSPRFLAQPRNLATTTSLWSNPNIAKVDKELVDFLGEEISQESKNRKTAFPSSIGEYQVVLKGAEVELKKSSSDETVSIKFNVNHSLSPSSAKAAASETASTGAGEKADGENMLSSPSFDVEVVRSGKTLSFTCSFAPDDEVDSADQDQFADLFTIDEVTMFEGEWKEHDYAVSGEILDGYLYDLFMNFLEARGINSEFMSQVQEFATSYEQNMYVGLLEGMKSFVSK